MSDKALKVFFVEDDPNLGFVIKDSLEDNGFLVDLFPDGAQALEGFVKSKYDIGLLDIMLPKMDGFTVAESIKSLDKSLPIIFLTAKGMIEDKVKGFKLGADDYMTKPFDIEELIMRIQAILRRSPKTKENSQSKFALGLYEFDVKNHELIHPEESRRLTKKEGELLRLLCIHKDQLLEREVALNSVWGKDDYFYGRSMDVFITKLRKYLKRDSRVEIKNIHGIGFKLMVHDNL